MLQSVPKIGQGMPRLLCTVAVLTPVVVQVIGPNTLYLAETNNALMQNDDSGLLDAVQINQASGLVLLWILGDLWAAGSAAFKAIIYVASGVNTGSGIGPVRAQPVALQAGLR